MDNFKIIYKILRALEQSLDRERINMADISAQRFGISENRWLAIIEMIVDKGLVKGIKVHYTADGECFLQIDRPMITMDGLQYLEENSMMQKAYRLIKGVKNITPGI